MYVYVIYEMTKAQRRNIVKKKKKKTYTVVKSSFHFQW